MTTAVISGTKHAGGSFLIEDHSPSYVLTLENLTERHKQFRREVQELAQDEIVPAAGQIEESCSLAALLIRRACEMGCGNQSIPEQYGGQGIDVVGSVIAADCFSVSSSFGVSFGVHAGMGALPIAAASIQRAHRTP